MPKSVVWWYKQWLNGYPESFHPSDVGQFYAFVHLLLAHSKKPRYRDWLEDNMREDGINLSEKCIKRYGQMYETIQEFASFWHTHDGKLLMQVRYERRLEAIKQRWAESHPDPEIL